MVTNLGRTVITAGLNAIGLQKPSDVILSTLVCPTVIEAVIHSGFRPVLVDVEDNLHVSVRTLKSA
jgi:dTDP-4-amino-4,6-dideoxygalactose transaminase